MHIYARAAGFGEDFSEAAMKKLEKEIRSSFISHERRILDKDTDFCEYRKMFGERIGYSVYGTVDLEEEFEKEYALPVFEGKDVTSYSEVTVEKKMDKEAYVGICEDVRVDISLMFHLQNPMEYIREKQAGKLSGRKTSVTLAAFALEGTVLLPIIKNEQNKQEQREAFQNRMLLLSAAREGDSEAIETLTLNDMDLYQQLTKRIERREDVFSIVDTYFMPSGVECDRYSIMGEIMDLDMDKNTVTGEKLLILTIDVNEMVFDLCVPKDKIIGEPEVGRRFRADIWLQGKINFS